MVGTMERELDPIVNEDPDVGDTNQGTPPAMFDLPADPPPTLSPIRGSAEIATIHERWSQMATGTPLSASRWSSMLRKSRSVMNRLLGRSDHDFLADLTRAIDAVAARCDEISDQLARQQILTNNIAESLGEEVTRLRANVAQLHERTDV
jgi:hypothetical protein